LLACAGEQDAVSIFTGQQHANQIVEWILRMVGISATLIGFRTMLNLVPVFCDLFPIVGGLICDGPSLRQSLSSLCLPSPRSSIPE
jgi:Transmembrane protein 43